MTLIWDLKPWKEKEFGIHVWDHTKPEVTEMSKFKCECGMICEVFSYFMPLNYMNIYKTMLSTQFSVSSFYRRRIKTENLKITGKLM